MTFNFLSLLNLLLCYDSMGLYKKVHSVENSMYSVTFKIVGG